MPYRYDGLIQQRFHFPDGLVEAYQNPSGNDAVTDVVLDDIRNMQQSCHIAIVQAMSGVDTHSQLVREFRRLSNGLHFHIGFFRALGICIAPGMDLDKIR